MVKGKVKGGKDNKKLRDNFPEKNPNKKGISIKRLEEKKSIPKRS